MAGSGSSAVAASQRARVYPLLPVHRRWHDCECDSEFFKNSFNLNFKLLCHWHWHWQPEWLVRGRILLAGESVLSIYLEFASLLLLLLVATVPVPVALAGFKFNVQVH